MSKKKKNRPANPCYACSSKFLSIVKDSDVNGDGDVIGTQFMVKCSGCDSFGPSGDTREEAIKRWNNETEIRYD